MPKTADLTKYLRPGQQLASGPMDSCTQVTDGRRPYEAYRVSKESKRHLEIRLKFPDPAECPLNSMITNVRVEWRMGLAVTLVYGNTMVVQINGERLQELAQAVKDWKVDWIAEYDPDEYAPPADPTAPVITRITIHTRNAEGRSALQ